MQVSFNLRVKFTHNRQTYSVELPFRNADDRENFKNQLSLFDKDTNVSEAAEWEDYVGLSINEARVELKRAIDKVVGR